MKELNNQMKKIGIDLGRHTIKIATITESKENSFLAEKHKTYPAVGDITSKEYYQALKNYISHFTEDIDARKIDVSVSISSAINDATHTEIMKLPTTDKKVLDKAIKFELEEQESIGNLGNFHYLSEELAVNIDEGPLEESGDTDVLVSAIHKNILFGIAQLRKPSISIKNVELQDRSYGRFLNDEEISLVIDFGFKNIRLYFYEGNKLIGVDSFEGGGFHLTKKVKEKMEATTDSVAEALIEKTSLNFGFTDEGEVLSDLLTDDITEYFNEITRTVRLFEIENITEIDKIYYTGGITQIENFPQLIRANFEYQTHNKFDCLPIEKTNKSEVNLGEEDNRLVPDINEFEPLVLDEEINESSNELDETADDNSAENEEGADSEAPDVLSRINFHENKNKLLTLFKKKDDDSTLDLGNDNDYPLELYSALYSSLLFEEESYLDDMDFSGRLRFMLDYNAFIIAALSFSVVLTLGVSKVSQHHDSKVNSIAMALTEESNEVSRLNNTIEELEKDIEESNEFINKINSLTDVKGWQSDTLFEIPEVTPKGVIVEDLSINGNDISIKGYALDYTQVGAFAIGLENLGDVSIQSVEDVRDSNIYATDIIATDQVKPDLQVTKSYEIKLQKVEEE